MKYIRTKDGRVAEVKDNMIVRQCDDATRLVYKDMPFVCVLCGNDDIEKETDSIVELADYFFHLAYNVDTDKYEINYWGKSKELNEYLKDYKRDLMFGIGIGEDKVFLAILTNKGLIYVAKMNDKGELELL